MGMLIDGKWNDGADRSMVAGKYRRESSALPSGLDLKTKRSLVEEPGRFFLIASASCPWSHAAVISLVLAKLDRVIEIQWAGGARVEGYGLLSGGPLPNRDKVQHLHQFYTSTVSDYTGRATVPVLWDAKSETIVSNSSADIISVFDEVSDQIDLFPKHMRKEIEDLTQDIFDGLSNAVYRAGKSQEQSEYDEAVDSVFSTMDSLEARLDGRQYLFGDKLTSADIRLFATLVRFDTVYATHFRCTRKRLTDYPLLWRFTRRIYQTPGVRETVDFDEIRFGYYVNDGDHNPHNIVGQQPEIDWENKEGISD